MRIIIVDDEKLIRDGLNIILSQYDDIEVVGTAENGLQALELCDEQLPDIVLMDIRMPVCDGVEGTKLIKEKHAKPKILILTTFSDIEYIKSAMENGASGYLLKDSSHDKIYEGLKSVYSGNVVLHPEIAQSIISSSSSDSSVSKVADSYDLTDKDLEIIKLLSDGLSNKEIAEKIFLSEGTVKNNVSNILSKLGLRDRTQLVSFAFKNGLNK